MDFLINKSANRFARRFLVRGWLPSGATGADFIREHQAAVVDLLDGLMLHDGVAVSVYGENIPLAMLIRTISIQSVEALLEQGCLEFVLQNVTITHLQSDLRGVMPLQGGVLTSGAHSDPEESAFLGLGWLASPVPEPTRRDLAKKAAKYYRTSPRELPVDAVDLACKAYEAGLFGACGLPRRKALIDLDLTERAKLNSLATDALDVAIMAVNGYEATESRDVFELTRAEFLRLRSIQAIDAAAATVFNVENLPQLGMLLYSRPQLARDLPRLRRLDDAETFRAWLRKQGSSADAAQVSAAYVDAAVNEKGFWQKNLGKLIRLGGATTISTLGGMLLAGPAGAALGAGVGLGVGGLDSFVLDRLAVGWTPKHFVDRVRREAQDQPKRQGRNERCSCGSGKKFKVCHGLGRPPAG